MPELPEVETLIRQLNPLLQGRRIVRLEIHDAKLQTPEIKELAGRLADGRCLSARRMGKLAVLHCRAHGGADLFLAVHLRMTGRLLWNGANEPLLERPARAIVYFAGGRLLFQDTRRFGTMRLVEDPRELAPAGVDPLADAFSRTLLAQLLAGSAQEVKPWLMRQDRLAGLGNIYASEILFAARIHPCRHAGSLDRAETGRLHAATRRILSRAIRHCGVTFSDFQDASGRMGRYQNYLAVYGKAGRICPDCGGTVARIVQQQRSTFFCPQCQR